MVVARKFRLAMACIFVTVSGTSVAQETGTVVDSARPLARNQRDVARMLLSPDSVVRLGALRMAQMVRPEHVGVDLRFALGVALSREADAYLRTLRSRREAGGAQTTRRPVTVVHDRFLTTVIALKEPRTIPALAHSLGTGMHSIRALVAFGEAAANPVRSVASDSTAEPEQTADALLALRMMVENAPTRALRPDTRAHIRDVAAARLSGRQAVDVLARAIDLAVALGDQPLRATVTAIATDPAEVRRHGIQDPEQVSKVQQRARDRLAGIPPMPRQ